MRKANTGVTGTVRRGEFTDQAWQQIEPLLPEYGQSGGQWRDHRTVINRASSGSYAPALPGSNSRRGTVSGRPAIEWLYSLEARRYLRSPSGPRPDQARHGRGARVGGERGRHGDPCSPEHAASASQASQTSRRKRGFLNPKETGLWGAAEEAFLPRSTSHAMARVGCSQWCSVVCGSAP
jgi:hypothetical protein